MTVTVSWERYGHIATDFFACYVEDDLENMWFQQDGATCHTTTALLQEKIPARVISRRGDINWPPRSCDLIFVYANNRLTLKRLKINIRQVIAEIPHVPVRVKKWMKLPPKNQCLQHFAWRSYK